MRKATNKNWQRVTAAAAALALCAGVLTGCGASSSTAASSTAASSAAASEVSSEEADEMAAKNVADLIDAIYVQERNENTDAQCEAAKAAWDALTDAQKELVEGEEADPDYFGRDTGDASKDDARNQDNIGDKEILVVSFGTSFNDSRAADIKGIEDAIQAAYPDWSVRRAFTAQIIINHVQARDGEKIDNMEQALERAVANGVKDLVIQPTHLMHGAEYDEMMEMWTATATSSSPSPSPSLCWARWAAMPPSSTPTRKLSPRPSPLRPSRPPVSTVWTPLLRTAPLSSSWATEPLTPQR